jgi:hypothetical protein
MDIWSKYTQLGIWGLWREFFSSAGDWFLLIRLAGRSLAVNGRLGCVAEQNDLSLAEVFTWSSGHGFTLVLFAGIQPPQSFSDYWSLLLHYESANADRRPSFSPFVAPVGEWSVKLNGLLAQPAQILVLNGQPGVGKRTVLQGLSLLHAGRLAELEPQSLNHWITPSGDIWIVPELAMLESDVQARIQKSVGKGARLWAATAYDLAILRARKIISSSFADMVFEQKIHFPPVSRRSQEEIEAFVEFWQAFHGQARPKQQTNLEFLKQRTLTGAQLSVGSILEEGSGLRGVIAEFEKEAIRQAHARVGRSQHKIARLLKVSRGSLQHKLRKYQLESYASADADTEDEGAP